MSKELEGKMWATRQFRSGGKDVGEAEKEEQRILIDTFESEPAFVEVSLGLTINLGNFESLRIDVGARIPCYKEELPSAQQEIFKLVESELVRRKREIDETL